MSNQERMPQPRTETLNSGGFDSNSGAPEALDMGYLAKAARLQVEAGGSVNPHVGIDPSGRLNVTEDMVNGTQEPERIDVAGAMENDKPLDVAGAMENDAQKIEREV